MGGFEKLGRYLYTYIFFHHFYNFQGIHGRRVPCSGYYFYFNEMASLSQSINCAANLFIYCWLGSRFRALLFRMCGCGKRMKIKTPATSMTSLSSLSSQCPVPRGSTLSMDACPNNGAGDKKVKFSESCTSNIENSCRGTDKVPYRPESLI